MTLPINNINLNYLFTIINNYYYHYYYMLLNIMSFKITLRFFIDLKERIEALPC